MGGSARSVNNRMQRQARVTAGRRSVQGGSSSTASRAAPRRSRASTMAGRRPKVERRAVQPTVTSVAQTHRRGTTVGSHYAHTVAGVQSPYIAQPVTSTVQQEALRRSGYVATGRQVYV